MVTFTLGIIKSIPILVILLIIEFGTYYLITQNTNWIDALLTTKYITIIVILSAFILAFTYFLKPPRKGSKTITRIDKEFSNPKQVAFIRLFLSLILTVVLWTVLYIHDEVIPSQLDLKQNIPHGNIFRNAKQVLGGNIPNDFILTKIYPQEMKNLPIQASHQELITYIKSLPLAKRYIIALWLKEIGVLRQDELESFSESLSPQLTSVTDKIFKKNYYKDIRIYLHKLYYNDTPVLSDVIILSNATWLINNKLVLLSPRIIGLTNDNEIINLSPAVVILGEVPGKHLVFLDDGRGYVLKIIPDVKAKYYLLANSKELGLIKGLKLLRALFPYSIPNKIAKDILDKLINYFASILISALIAVIAIRRRWQTTKRNLTSLIGALLGSFIISLLAALTSKVFFLIIVGIIFKL